MTDKIDIVVKIVNNNWKKYDTLNSVHRLFDEYDLTSEQRSEAIKCINDLGYKRLEKELKR